MEPKKNKGFTLVELVVVLLILAIITAIAVPVTISLIDSSREADRAMDAKNLWDAAQAACTDQLVKEEGWLGSAGACILNESNWNSWKDIVFEGKFLFIGTKKMGMNILSKAECSNKLEALYVGTGDYETYYTGNNYDYAYRVFLIAFKYKDDEKFYFYDGNEVFTTWPFSKPNSVQTFSTSQKGKYIFDKRTGLNLQFYSILTKDSPATKFANYFKANK